MLPGLWGQAHGTSFVLNFSQLKSKSLIFAITHVCGPLKNSANFFKNSGDHPDYKAALPFPKET